MKALGILFLLCLTVLFSGKAISQPNSVELQDGNGNLISLHSGIEEAYNAIPAVISQAYIIEILSSYAGTSESFPIDLTFRTGSSSVNTITIRPDAGNTGEAIVTNNTAGCIRIDNADYIVFDGRPGGTGSAADLEVRNNATSGTNSNTFELLNGTTNCVIKYCNIFNSTQNSAGPRAVEFSVSVSETGGNSDNAVEYCNINGARSGVGSDGTTANPNRNNRVSNCNIQNFGFAGVWALNGTKSMLIEGNTISTPGVNVTNPSGISLQTSLDSAQFTIRNNKVINIGSTSTSTSLTIRGIVVTTAPGTGTVLNIHNNFIALNLDNQSALSVVGIITVGTAEPYTANIYHNTVHIGGNHTGGVSGRLVSAGIVKQSTFAGINYNLRNNISINNRTGGASGVIHAGIAFNGIEGILDMDYNCYFASASGSFPVTWDSAGISTVPAYVALSGEENVRFKNVNFVTNTDLHLTGTSVQDPDLSARQVGIITDIDGETRSATFPYKGADESTAFILSTLNLTVYLERCSPMQDTVTVSLRSATSPFGLVETARGYLNPSGSVSLNFAKPVSGVPYYIVVEHRNSIETWSKSGGETFSGGLLNYDFTTAASQAFGSNQVQVGSEFAIYAGDVNQDDIVDITDVSLIDNDAFNFATGYLVTDLDCNGIVDVSDLTYCDNNASIFAAVIRP